MLLYQNIIIAIAFVLPILRNSLFWAYVWQFKEYRLDRLFDFIKSPEWIRALFSKTCIFELLIFIILLSLHFLDNFNHTLTIVSCFLIIENVFTIFKIFKWWLLKPKPTSRLILTLTSSYLIQVLFFMVLLNTQYLVIYLFILLLWQIDLIWIWIFLIKPISSWQRSKVISKAKLKIKKLSKLTTIWVTWSCGKSTTKEILSHILSSKYNVISTPENKNTPLWISYCIINDLKKNTEIFVCEMWAYILWEIRELWEIVNHKHWIITEISNQHISLFKGQENIIKWKFELSEKIFENKGKLYINWDSNNCLKWLENKKEINAIRYWIKNQNTDWKASLIKQTQNSTAFSFKYKWHSYKFTTNLIWEHNVLNLIWALSICFDLWLNEKQINEKINNINLDWSIFKIKEINWNLIIDNSYNSSYLWIIANCKTLSPFKKYDKILVIDDILELWSNSKDIHFKLGIKLNDFNLLIFCSFVIMFFPIQSTGAFFSTWNGFFYWLIYSFVVYALRKKT